LELVAIVGVLDVVEFPICDKLNSSDFALFMAHSSLGLFTVDIGEIYDLFSTTVTFPFHSSKSKFCGFITIFILGGFLVISFQRIVNPFLLLVAVLEQFIIYSM